MLSVRSALSIAVLALTAAACAAGQTVEPTPTQAPAATSTRPPEPSATPLPTQPEPTQTSSPTPQPTSTPIPTPVGGGLGKIAFTQSETTDIEGEFIQNLMVINVDGGELTSLTGNDLPRNIFDPDWSPAGDQLVFTMVMDKKEPPYERVRNFFMFTTSLMDSKLVKVPPAPEEPFPTSGSTIPTTLSELDPDWSPDGSVIVFTSNLNNWTTSLNNQEIFLFDLQSNAVRQLTSRQGSNQDDNLPEWSPDGKRIAFVVNDSHPFNPSPRTSTIHIMEAGAALNETIPITEGFTVPDDPGGDTFTPAVLDLAWSPDGQKILFVSMHDGDEELYLINPDGSELQQLTDNSFRDFLPQWSADGAHILFTSDRDGNLEIYMLNLQDLAETNLTNHPEADIAASVSPDGEWIAFQSDREGEYDILIMKLDGSEIKNLTQGNGVRDRLPVWSP